MRRRAVFIDVDGTLLDSDGRVPASAVTAIRAARARGHLVFLCTGRSPGELWPALLDIGFDGLVGASGAWVTVGDTVLAHHAVPDAALRHARDFFARHDTDVYLQAVDRNHATAAVRQRLLDALADPEQDAEAFARGPFGFVDRIDTSGDLAGVPITKVLYLRSPVPLADLRAEFAGEFDLTPSSIDSFGRGSGEMTVAGLHKATGLDVIVDHLGLDRAATIAIGDGFNDLELLQHAGVGIAMGNAPDAVKAAADEVTAAVDADGLAAAFARHGLVAEDSR